MALMTCPDCGREHSDIAMACPQCARPRAPTATATQAAVSRATGVLNVTAVRFSWRAAAAGILAMPIAFYFAQFVFLGPIESLKLSAALRAIAGKGEAVVMGKDFEPWRFLLDSSPMRAMYIATVAAGVGAFILVEQRRQWAARRAIAQKQGATA